VHFLGLGFRNPETAGQYPIQVTAQPDPTKDDSISSEVMIDIIAENQPFIAPNSQANGKPPPPFANTMHQTINAGDSSLKMRFFMWDKVGKPLTGSDFVLKEGAISGDIVVQATK